MDLPPSGGLAEGEQEVFRVPRERGVPGLEERNFVDLVGVRFA